MSNRFPFFIPLTPLVKNETQGLARRGGPSDLVLSISPDPLWKEMESIWEKLWLRFPEVFLNSFKQSKSPFTPQ
jgi:hypothetical protein